MVTKKMPKNAENFNCIKCNFICSKKSNFEMHLTTLKHKMVTNGNEENAEKCQPKEPHICECGRTYQYMSGLSRHKKTCNPSNQMVVIVDSKPHLGSGEIGGLTKIILELVRENKDFKDMLAEQHKTMVELANKNTVTNNTTHTNSHNKQFNLNFFLNEQCKNAINLSEFIENVKMGFTDLENVADSGYVDGVTQIFMNGLRELDIYTRPLHCTDIKREIVHVRENNSWIKDTSDQDKIKSAIRRLAFRNVQQISSWNELHPESAILDSDDFNRAFQIMKQSLGNTGPGGVEKNNDKIAKNLMRAVYLDKQSIENI